VVDEGNTDNGIVALTSTPLSDAWGGADRSLTIAGRARATAVNATYHDVSVSSGADLTTPKGTQQLTLDATSLTVGSGARIDLSGRGDPSGQTSAPSGVASKRAAGGSHGGAGGAGLNNGVPGDTYDDPNDPALPGAGGGTAPSTSSGQGQPGGGVITITTTTLTDNGRIQANGARTDGPTSDNPLIYDTVGGGGAGGAIDIHTTSLSGAGKVAADGADVCLPASQLLADPDTAGCSGPGSGAGGGGRVFLGYGDVSAWTGTLTADRGTGESGTSSERSAIKGDAGTVTEVQSP
jgi:hypothetical protein